MGILSVAALPLLLSSALAYYVPPQYGAVAGYGYGPAAAPVAVPSISAPLPTDAAPSQYVLDEAAAGAYWAKRIANGFPFDELPAQPSALDSQTVEQETSPGSPYGTEQFNNDELLTNEGSGTTAEGSGAQEVEEGSGSVPSGYALPTEAVTTTEATTTTMESTTTTGAPKALPLYGELPGDATTPDASTTTTTEEATTEATFGYGIPQLAALVQALKDMEEKVESTIVSGYGGWQETTEATTTAAVASTTSTASTTTVVATEATPSQPALNPYILNQDAAAAFWATAVYPTAPVAEASSAAALPYGEVTEGTTAEATTSTAAPTTTVAQEEPSTFPTYGSLATTAATPETTTTTAAPTTTVAEEQPSITYGSLPAVDLTVAPVDFYAHNEDSAAAYWSTASYPKVPVTQATTTLATSTEAPTTTAATEPPTTAAEATTTSAAPSTTIAAEATTVGKTAPVYVPAPPPGYGFPARPVPFFYGYPSFYQPQYMPVRYPQRPIRPIGY